MRYAIYFTPPNDDALTGLASVWLGRDAFTGLTVARPRSSRLTPEELAFHTAPARRYGFHATIKAPFRLADDASPEGLGAALEAFGAHRAPFTVKLALRQMGGFFALVPEVRSPALDQLAGDVVTAFASFGAPLSDAEIERRNPENLSPEELRNLHQWGYPYVFEEFRFHMTLTGRVAADDALRVRAAIEEHFGDLLHRDVEIGSLALFTEDSPGEPFHVLSCHPFQSMPERKTA